MKARLRERLTYANVVSTMCLFLLLGGTAAAVDGSLPGQNTVGSADIINGEVTRDDLGANSVGTDNLLDGRVKNDDLASGAADWNTIRDNGVRSIDVRDDTLVGGGLTGDDIDESTLQGLLPAGAVSFFNLAACPAGWSELTAARGRYLVGLPGGGTLLGGAGTALTNNEDRPVGQHNHSISDPGHSHRIEQSVLNGFGTGFLPRPSQDPPIFGFSDFATTGITVNNAGSVAGTNAPYLQLLACEKD